MKITRNQLRRIIYEQIDDQSADNNEHHWPRVDWNDVGILVDKWAKGEEDAFDPGDPSMNDRYDTTTEAKKAWSMQVDTASMDLEAELTTRIRKIALQTMQEYTDKLINGDYS